MVSVIKQQDETQPFFHAVNTVKEPTYLNVIDKPMNFTLVSNNINHNVYNNRADFMEHVELIASNANVFYGPDHQLARAATKIRGVVERNLYLTKDITRTLTNFEMKVSGCREAQLRLSSFFVYLIVKKFKQVPYIWPFLSAVNRKCSPGYDGADARPMEMSTLLKNVQQHKLIFNNK